MADALEPSALLRCACFNTRTAARAVTQYYDKVLEPSGLGITQFAIVGAIRVAGTISMQALARHLHLDASTLTRTLAPLEAAGVVRVEEGEDRRTKEAVLTALGHRRCAEAQALWKKAQADVTEKLGEKRLERLLDDLAALTAALR